MATPLSGQVALGASALPLTATQGARAMWVVKAPLTNNQPAFIGPVGVTLSTGHQLDPGDEFAYEFNSPNLGQAYEVAPSDVYVCGTSGDKVTWFASP